MTATMTRTERLAPTDVLKPARRRWPAFAMDETPDVVDVAITFVYRPSREDDGQAVPAPASCEIR